MRCDGHVSMTTNDEKYRCHSDKFELFKQFQSIQEKKGGYEENILTSILLRTPITSKKGTL